MAEEPEGHEDAPDTGPSGEDDTVSDGSDGPDPVDDAEETAMADGPAPDADGLGDAAESDAEDAEPADDPAGDERDGGDGDDGDTGGLETVDDGPDPPKLETGPPAARTGSGHDDSGESADETDDDGGLDDTTGDDGDDGGLRKVDDGPDERPPPDAEPPSDRTRSGNDESQVEEEWTEFYQQSPATPDDDDEVGGLAPGGVPAPDPEKRADDDGDEPEDITPGESDLANEIAEDGPLETEIGGETTDTAPAGAASGAGAEAAPAASPAPDAGGSSWDEPAHPPDDEEMPLADHIEEMVRRFGFVVVFGATVTALAYPFSEEVVLVIWDSLFPATGEGARDPHLYAPLEKITTQIKVASLLGILTALPMLVYQSYRFMRPGLYPHERRYYLAAVPTSLVFAAAGMAFSYFVVLPALFLYFLYYTEDTAVVAFGLQKTFDLIVTLTGFLAVIFQIPLFIMLAIMLGVTSREWLASKRLYFWGGFVLVAGLFAPDPTGMAPIIVAITEVILFEGTLLLLKWTDRG